MTLLEFPTSFSWISAALKGFGCKPRHWDNPLFIFFFFGISTISFIFLHFPLTCGICEMIINRSLEVVCITFNFCCAGQQLGEIQNRFPHREICKSSAATNCLWPITFRLPTSSELLFVVFCVYKQMNSVHASQVLCNWARLMLRGKSRAGTGCISSPPITICY